MSRDQLPEKAELLVIGAGPGGYSAAFRAADLGFSVVLVDPEENPGGVCLYRGCIPSKALLHVAGLINETAEADKIGLGYKNPEVDIDRVREWKDEVVGKLTSALGAKVKKQKLQHVRGLARFRDSRTVTVTTEDGDEGTIRFEKAIIATGSRPINLDYSGDNDGRIIDSTGALELPDVPENLLVIGGGYIGLELGSVYAALGSRVTVAELTDGLLPGADRDLVSVLKRRLDKKFEAIMTGTKVAELKVQKNGVMVTFENKKGESSRKLYDKVLIAVGRKPNTGNIGIENTDIDIDENGFVEVDGQMRTSESHIFAIGDIAGEPMLAHKAYAEAEVAAAAAAGEKAVFEPRGIPAVVFTDPEIAWCGLTESEAKEQGIAVKTAKMPWRGNGRTLSLGRDDGMTKLIADKENGRLLGMAVVGPGAGELIAEGVLGLEMAAVIEDLASTIHPHPSLSETIWDVARSFKAE